MGTECERDGIAITRWPPILSIQLERFRSAATLDSRFSYPSRLDLSEFGAEGGVYTLHSVLVHTGHLGDRSFHAYGRESGAAQAAGKAPYLSSSLIAAARPAERLVPSLGLPWQEREKVKACDLEDNLGDEALPRSDGHAWFSCLKRKACELDANPGEHASPSSYNHWWSACRKRKARKLDNNSREQASPSGNDRTWFRFEDARVTSSFECAAVQANFGGAFGILDHETLVLNMMGSSQSFTSEAARAHRACALMYVQYSRAAAVPGP